MNGMIAAIAWLGALSLQGLTGPLAPPLRLALALAALLFVLVHGLRRRPDWRRRCAGLALCLPAVALLQPDLARGVAYAGAVALVSAPELAGLGPALFLCTLGTALWGWLPGAPDAGAAFATWLGNAFDPGSGAALQLGPSAAALPAALWALVLLLSRALHAPRPRRWLPALLLLPVPLLAQWWLGDRWQHQWGPHAGHAHPGPLFGNLPWALGGLALLQWLAWSGAPQPRAARGFSGRQLAAGLAAGAALALVLCGWRGEGRPDRRLAVLNMGGLDWDRPNFGELGAFSGGMFGMLPLYLRGCGWEVRTVEESELPGFSRAQAQVLVLINCHRLWSEAERARLRQFVEDGGSLLVLGDHTDVFGLMRGFNSLLEPWGIGFHFDSAYHDGKDWEDDLAWKPGGPGMGQDPMQAGIAVGASLEVHPPARTWITGRYAFSDLGIRENVMGSFLGDYTWERGERLGDVSLVAGLHLGRGRVLVYGDTSGYQNGGLSWFFTPHIEPLLSELARRPLLPSPYALEAALAALALLGAALLLALRLHTALAGAGIALAAGALLQPHFDAEDVLERSDLGRALLLDQSHFPETGHYDAGWNVAAPLETGATRCGLSAYHMDCWEPELVARARVIALIGSRAPYTRSEIEQLQQAMEAGATVLVAASAPDLAGVTPLLQHFGVTVEPRSLGSVPPEGRQDEQQPRFVNPSELHFAPDTPYTSLYRYGEPVLAAAVPVGRGWLLVFGDTRWFSMGNVEGMWGWWGGNLRFLRDVFGQYLGGQPDDVANVFPPPIRPEGE